MALDRQTIERKDFPIGRRGYEPEAVDSHLADLAAQVDRLQRQLSERPAGGGARSGAPASLAAAASEQVRMIVEAAETSAREIEEAAEAEAERIRSEADADAEKTRSEAIERSEEHVGQVSESANRMLERIDAMEGELGGLLDALRTGANRLTADLSLLQGQLGELHDGGGLPAPASAPAVAAPGRSVPEQAAPVEPPEAAPAPTASRVEPEAEAADSAPAPAPVAAAAPASSAAGGDVEGARLIALNMALNGQSREETDAYLRDNFDLGDRDALLDEVYASVG